MTKKVRIVAIAVFFALVVAAGIVVCLNMPKAAAGQKEFTVEVKSERDAFDETTNCKSDMEYLGEYLRTFEGLEFDETEYGIFITGFKGMEQDMDNQYWWCVYVNGESATLGADEIPLNDGDAYALVLTQGW